jgi:two-component sensor histidine kinase
VNRLINNFQDALVERRRSEDEISLRNQLIQVFLTEADTEVFPALLRIIGKTLHSPTVCIELFDAGMTRCSQIARESLDGGDRFTMTSPMLHHGRPLGEIRVQRSGPGYTDYDHRLVITIATVLAPILSARVDREREEEQRRRAEREIRASLAEKETLLREIHHRVKNNLQVISSLLSLQSDASGDRDFLDLLTESQNRISSIALVHEELYKSTDLSRIDMGDYVEKLISRMATIYREERSVECRIDADPVRLNLDQAIPCGLIVNELVTNCYKHAFRDREDGKIVVRLRRSEGMLLLDVIDDGVGIPDPVPAGGSLGWLLIQSLVGQLHGSAEVERNGGTRVTVTFPGSRPGGEDAAGSPGN